MNAKPEIRYSACPHDCPSTCALEVERLDARTVGRLRGAADNLYTAGVICAKVARYAATVLEACAYCGSGDVLKVQQMLAACGEHPDPESEAFQAEGDAHQVTSLCPDPHSNPGGVS